jgi:hypothetical protein
MKRPKHLPPNLEPLARAEAADLISVSIPTWDGLVRSRRLSEEWSRTALA